MQRTPEHVAMAIPDSGSIRNEKVIDPPRVLSS
jgi:hypothetical protein